MNGCAVAARNDANHAGICGQWTLAFRGKQAFGGQALLEAFEGFEKRASTGRTHVCRDELELSSRRVDGRSSNKHDTCAIGEHAARSRRRRFVHDAVDRRGFGFILELEVRMAAGVLAHAGDFAEHPKILCAAFDEALQAIVEFGDGDDGRFVRAPSTRPLHDGALATGPKFRNGVRVTSTGVREIGALVQHLGLQVAIVALRPNPRITPLHRARGVARKCPEGK